MFNLLNIFQVNGLKSTFKIIIVPLRSNQMDEIILTFKGCKRYVKIKGSLIPS